MEAWSPTRKRSAAMLAVAVLLLVPGSALSQNLPWEVTVAEIEAGRLRNLAERLNKQYLLYQLRLGEVRKEDIIETATRIDRLIEALERGVPSRSIPAPWNETLRARITRVDTAWGPLRKIAVASPYELMRVSRQFAPAA
ncbi:MAG: type IV pili methyl-accepting chemotaxis transducer N-terminal domain-containing protein, partial [Myxococcota bacterium]